MKKRELPDLPTIKTTAHVAGERYVAEVLAQQLRREKALTERLRERIRLSTACL
jgi:ferritin-like metal-binding protein YciE